MSIADIPEIYKPISTYIRVAAQFKSRDSVLYYWILNYVVEQALTISNAAEGKQFLVNLLNELEKLKKANPGDENYMQGPLAQSRVEGQAVNLFKWADDQDRSKNHGKEVIQAFYNAAHLFDVVTLFGKDALDEKTQSARKYAKWRATHINTCLKQGIEPQPPSSSNEGDDELTRELLDMNVKPQPQPRSSSNQAPAAADRNTPTQQNTGGYGTPYQQTPNTPGGYNTSYQQPPPQQQQQQHPSSPFGQQPTNQQSGYGQPLGFGGQPPQQQNSFGQSGAGFGGFPPQPQYPPAMEYHQPTVPLPISASGKEVTLEEFIDARKFTKMAMSALDYEDAKTSVDFLRKAISVLEK